MFPSHELHCAVAVLAGAVGGLLRGFAGFGFGLAAVPILIVTMPPVDAIPAVLIHEVMFGVLAVPEVRHAVAWDRLATLVGGSLLGTPVGLAMLNLVPADTMRLVVGLIILASVILLWWMPRPVGALTTVNLGVAGLLSGILNGSTAASGPPPIVLLFASDLPPRQVRGLLMVFILASALIAVALAALTGLVTPRVVAIAAVMMPGVLVGSWAGRRLFERLGAGHYRRISLVLLSAVSVAALGLRLIPLR